MKMELFMKWALTLLLLPCLLRGYEALAQRNFDDVEITVIRVAEGLHMLQGQGGNIAVLVGPDGTFMIDDQYAPLTDKIIGAVKTLSDRPVKFLINTHWHSDHTGGNENMGKTGAIIVAHENVRERLLRGLDSGDRKVPPAPPAALPVVTFSESVTFYWNGETLNIEHVGPAHTDGDSVIYFKNANAVHMGDLYFNGFYPYIDAGSGGSIAGMVEETEQVLSRIDKHTKVIPGHGPLSNKKELEAYRQMLATVHTRIRSLKNKGKSLEEIVAAKPTADFDEKWGNGFLAPDQWVGIVYSSL